MKPLGQIKDIIVCTFKRIKITIDKLDRVIFFILMLMKQKALGQQADMLIWIQITGLITQSISEVKQDFGAVVTQDISFSKLITCCMLNTAGKTSYNESISGYYRT